MVFRVGDPPIKVRWYFVDCDHEAFPGWHAFGSANWMSRAVEAGALGEQPGLRPWVNGSPPANAGAGDLIAVECAEVDPSWWTSGIPTGEETGPYDENGLPVCCTDGPPDVEPCPDCGSVPDVDMSLLFECPGCPNLDGTSWTLTFNAFPGNWTANGLELNPDCPTPNVGALVVSRVLATEPCELLLEGGQLFCFGLGTLTATAICDGDGEFLYCEWSGTITSGVGACDAVPFTATLTIA